MGSEGHKNHFQRFSRRCQTFEVDIYEYKKGRYVFIRKNSKEYKHKRVPISIQRHKDGGVMEQSVLDTTDTVRHQKQGLTTSYVRYIEGTFVVKLRGQKLDNHFSVHNYL